ncbi:hypothetical protein DPMN_150797 [Dreissena polymorpha]|uniref:Uncharacterized protein n=1 Tax=Dreissena polymorpha TaxID=45954 RepID=A0A9D4FIN4_DREPO|nr:hypothetical protein DPMN_150797 [Dreissena polymorpha]
MWGFPSVTSLKCHLAVSCLVPVPNLSINLKEDENQAAFTFINDNQGAQNYKLMSETKKGTVEGRRETEMTEERRERWTEK